MDFFGLLWLFLIISSLQPVIRQRMLEMERMRAMERLEKQRNSRVIALIHRQETMSFLGFPLARYIDIDDSEALLRAIKMTDDDVPIDLIVHTPGGLVLAAEQIAHALKRHPAKVTVFVPHYAMSGGTLIALAADEIVMDENAVLGPVDPQLGHQPAASILKVIERKPISEIDDDTLIMADIAEKALRQVKQTVLELLHDRMDAEKAEKVATTLSTGVFTHDYPITVDEARALGLPVSTEMPKIIYEMMALYPQTAQRRPSVEYIPVPRRSERTTSGR
ncbi:SDH family Clp fold serine proteinase [Caldilinea sp.]|uniref:SDH family Clp fold serine proteinase n=1 Tax=Caldilinea sp. TaxID=2293560 RepID=UPI00261C7002|nr:ATP-dependent Clp protease proteolytic subunit [uncultured Caldilinea sp.]